MPITTDKLVVVFCPLCGDNSPKAVANDGEMGWPTHVKQCGHCGFVYLTPRWTKERYDYFYAEEYEQYFPQKKQNKGPVIEVYDRLNAYKPFSSVLDVGAADGTLLNMFNTNLLYAIEPSKPCHELLKEKGVEVIASNVEDEWTGKFALITMRHVLEHILDPLAALKRLRLACSEYIYIAVPDISQPLFPLNRYWRARHVSYFSPETLIAMLLQAGFNIIETGRINNEVYVIASPAETTDVCLPDYKEQRKYVKTMLRMDWKRTMTKRYHAAIRKTKNLLRMY